MLRPYVLLFILASAVSTAGIRSQEAPQNVPFEYCFPEQTFFYYEVSDIPKLKSKIASLPVADLVKTLEKTFRRIDARKNISEQLSSLGINGNDLKHFFKGNAVFGLFPVKAGDADRESLEWCFITDIGTVSKDFDFARENIFRKMQNRIGVSNVTNTKYQDYTITSYFKGEEQIFNYTVFRNYFAASGTKNELVKIVYRMKKKRNGTLVENVLYKLVKPDSEKNRDARFFLDAAGIASHVRNILPEDTGLFLKYLEPTGILQTRALFGTMQLGKTGVEESFVIYFKNPKGFIPLLESKENATFDFKSIPGSAVSARVMHIDPIRLWITFGTLLKEYSAITSGADEWIKKYEAYVRSVEVKSGIDIQKDILSNMNKTFVEFVLPVRSGTIRGQSLAPVYGIEVFDAEALRKNLISLFNNGLKQELSVKEKGDYTIYYRQIDRRLYVAFVFIKDKLFLSLHHRILDLLITNMEQEKKSILDHNAFSELIKDDQVTSVSYVDFSRMLSFLGKKYDLSKKFTLKRLVAVLIEGQKDFFTQTGISPASLPLPEVTFPGLDIIGKHLGISTQKTSYKNNTLYCRSVFPVPIQLVCAGAGVIGVQMMPFIQQQHEQSRINLSRKRLQDISFNINLYALEHNGKYPDSLADLYPQYAKTLEIFAAPGKESSLKFKSDISRKGMFVFRKINDIANIKPEKVILYQKNDVHPSGFFVLLKNGIIQWRDSSLFKKTVMEFKESNVEIIE